MSTHTMFLFSIKTYVVGTYLMHLAKMPLMSSHNIFFYKLRTGENYHRILIKYAALYHAE